MKLLQVLQKASSLETFQDDGVAGGQADAGPAGEQRERQVDVSMYKYALEATRRIYAAILFLPTCQSAQQVQCREEEFSSSLIMT